jgi:phosphatidylglycerol:prolipoprotein diacylglycerol transferase
MFTLSLSPIAFSIFGCSVYWYGILYSFAIFSAWRISAWLLKKLRNNNIKVPTKEEFDKFMLFAILSILIGARIGHVLFFEFEYYINNPLEILMIRNGGLSFHGAFIGLCICLYLYAKRTSFSWKIMADILCFSAAIGLGIGRIANFINQELYGKISVSECSVIFAFVDYMPRYPTQLFESFFEGFLNFWIMFITLRLKGVNIVGKGKLSAAFCIIYSSSRFIIEFFKEVETYSYFNFIALTIGQILCFALFIFGIFMLRLKDENSIRGLDD